ncbi:MAG: hypothetical protein V1885_03305 [Candidatus Brennerbacteria bacterium]
MAKTSRDAWRHYAAWINFFSAAGEVINGEALAEFIRLYKEQKELRQSFRRFVSRGFIKKSASGWKLTNKGIRFFRRTQKKSLQWNAKMWDGKWRLVSFDVPVEHNSERAALRALLDEFDFRPLQKSVWASPHAAEEEFLELMIDKDLGRYCKIMVVDILEGDEELRRRFKIPSR